MAVSGSVPTPDSGAAPDPHSDEVVVRPAEPWALALRIVLAAVAIVGGLWLAYVLLGVLLKVLAAVILATGLQPLVRRLNNAGVPRGAAVLLIYLGLIVALVLFGVAIVPPIVAAISDVVINANAYGEVAIQTLHDLQARFPFLPALDEQIIEQVRGLGGQIGALAGQALVVAQFALSIFSGLLSTVLVLLITLYLIVDGKRVRDYFLSFFAPRRHARLRLVTERMGERMGGWLIGQVTLSLVMGVSTFIGLTIIGVQGAIILALLAAIGEAIPILGPILAGVPAVIVAATQSPVHAIATLVLYIVLQQLENNLLVPKIMERAVKLHPLAVVLALLVGGELLGVAGTLVAVPVAAALAVVMDEVRYLNGQRGADFGALAAEAPRMRDDRPPITDPPPLET